MRIQPRLAVGVLFGILFLTAPILSPAQSSIDPEFVRSWGTMGDADGQLNGPEGLSVHSNGDVYVADTVNNRVQVFTSEGEFVRAWGGFCDISEFENCSDPNGEGQFNSPEGLVVDSVNERVYVSDTLNNRIQVFDLEGNFQLMWGEPGGDDSQLNLPLGLDVDSSGRVYVADLLNHRIQVFESDGAFVLTWGSVGPAEGQFTVPVDVAIHDNDIYVIENATHRVQQFDLEGTFIRTWGSSCDLAIGEGCDTPGGEGQFLRPFAIAVDQAGNVYVVDQSNHRVQIFDDEGQFITQFGSVCTLFGDDEIPAGTGCQTSSGVGQFFLPKGIDIGQDGNIYVSDSDNHRIQLFESD